MRISRHLCEDSLVRGAQSYPLNVGKPASQKINYGRYSIVRNAFDGMRVANLEVATGAIV